MVAIEDARARAEIAIAAFPPTEGEVIIRAYEKKNGSLFSKIKQLYLMKKRQNLHRNIKIG